MKGVEQLKHAPLRVFAELDAAAKSLRRRIEHDQLDLAPLAERTDSRGDFGQHSLVQQIVLGAVERQIRHFAFAAELDELKILELRRACTSACPAHRASVLLGDRPLA